MKSLKKLLAVLIVVTLMAGMIAVPAFAASFNYEEEASVLNQLDLFKGKSATEYVPALEDRLLREEAVALLLRMFSLEEEAEAMGDKEADDLLAKFKDADQIAAWARKYVAYAVKNEIVVGRPDGNFAPQDNLIGREYSKMLLAMLGYVQGVDFEYEFSTSQFADVAGFPKSEAVKLDEDPLIRDDVVGMSFFALQAEYFAGPNAGKTVIEVIVGDDEDMKAIAIAAGLMEEAVVVEVAALDDIVIKVGEELKLPATVKATLSDGKEADVAVTWPAIDTSKAMEKTEFEGTIADTDVVAKINVTIEVDALLVVDGGVTADNLVEVNVEYNQDVSENTAVADKANYSLSVGKVASVSVDGNTAVLRLEKEVANQTKAKLTVNDKILDEKETFEFTYFDATLPKVLDIEITGPKSLNVKFSEPIAEYGKVTLKSGGSTLSVNNSRFAGKDTATITIPLYSTLNDGKAYEITFKEFKDYAGYANEIRTIEFVYEKDETPPVATVDEATQEYVKVSFNKPVKGLTPEHFSHTFSAWTAMSLTTKGKYAEGDDASVVKATESYKTVYAWFYKNGDKTLKDKERPIPEGETSFTIRAKNADGTEVKDEWGNKFAGETYTISVVADKTAPEVKAIKVETERSISIEFTKTVTFKNDNIEVLDDSGNKIDGVKVKVKTASPDTKFEVDLGKELAGKSILVNIKNVEDATLNANKLDLYSEVIDITDQTPPGINMVAYADDDTEKRTGFLYVFYNEAVDEDTALKVSNYFLFKDAQHTKLTGATSFFNDKTVKIALTASQYTIAKNNGTKLFVTGVEDLAGNAIDKKESILWDINGELDSANKPAMNVSKIFATATDKIEITFNQELIDIADDAFDVKVGANDYTVEGMDIELASGVTKVILTVERVDDGKVYKLPYDVDGVVVTLKEDKVINAFETKNDKQEVTFDEANDKIAPALYGNPVQDGALIKLTFTEKVDRTVDADLAASDFVITNKSDDDKVLVAGNDYTIEKASDDIVNIVLYKNYDGNELNVATNDSRKYFIDQNGNKLAAFDKDITMAARSTGVVQDPGTTGGDGLDYSFDEGVLNISMKTDGDPVPYVQGGAPEHSYWIGVAIDVPNGVNVTEPVELKVGDNKYNTDLDYDFGFWYYFHAGDVELPSTATDDDVKVSGEQVLEIKWNSTYTEKVTVKYDVVVEKAAD
jgi:hypothetical protein